MLSAFTIVRNAIKLDFPIVPAIRSVLEVCDEVVVNVGESDDGTRDLVASLHDPRVRILDSRWDFTKQNEMLSIETRKAMAACRDAGASTSRPTRCCTRPERASCKTASPNGTETSA